jgi:hypothetical protein
MSSLLQDHLAKRKAGIASAVYQTRKGGRLLSVWLRIARYIGA